MINPQLREVCFAIDSWCEQNNVKYDLVCDESDIQGFMLFKKNRSALNGLVEHLRPMTSAGNIHLEMRKVRGGNILAVSLKAITESEIKQILAEAGEEEIKMPFKDRINDAFSQVPLALPKSRPSFTELAKEIVESEKKPKSKKVVAEKVTREVKKRLPLRFESRIKLAFELPTEEQENSFDRVLSETLSGMATPDNSQPGDLFNQFARALQVLGQQMGIGPLQEQLKQQGIQWKKSDDGLAIILYIDNATTGAPQPIARVTAETLANPRDFEDQLTNMLDFAKGEAPGSLRQKQAEMKEQEGAIRDIAQAISPENQESEVAKQMNGPQVPGAVPTPTPAAPAAAPVAPPPAPPEQAAAAAASPKTLSAGRRTRSGLV